ncbi:monooxygenase [Chelatococcus reniformis]|uniref:Monooxygenase n=1 Tax=Chelatococcus reniformis TaxID=1494448 RepID=A0A916TX63_9HYPH|nr:monooxygenase [Chelatococcus reniformis]
MFDRYFEEYAVLDQLGINIAVNEHHASFQCMSPSPMVIVAALARTTSRVRLLSIGSPIAQRLDPVRLAEEMALTDILSRGRTEVGLIKSIPWEHFNSNSNPMEVNGRFWEAHDLILKALTTRDGPFSWAGEYFHFRNVNIVPRPYQDPHPPIWMTGQSIASAENIGRKGYVCVTSQSGFRDASPFYASYRKAYEAAHGRPTPLDRLGYMGYMAVGRTEDEAGEIAQRIHKWVEFLGSQHPSFQYAAGFAPAAAYASGLRRGMGGVHFFLGHQAPSIHELREKGMMFWGTVDQVYEQVRAFYKKVGGIGHLLMQMGGTATKEDTLRCMDLVANKLRPMLEGLANEPVHAEPERLRA